jgi:hypothetical protein
MDLAKPYYRIMRPLKSRNMSSDYIFDQRYSNDRSLLCRSYLMLENDLNKLFEYIEPSDNNKRVYSHRTYELFLRAATEFETNCKGILLSNRCNKAKSDKFNIEDYHKINQPTKLSDYEVRFEAWSPNEHILKPFGEWNNGHTLRWYQDYNNVKHYRSENFNKASLENLIKSITSVYVILFAQFGINAFNPFHKVGKYESDKEYYIYDSNSMFSIKCPEWPKSEKYDFDWDVLSKQSNPFNDYNFL